MAGRGRRRKIHTRTDLFVSPRACYSLTRYSRPAHLLSWNLFVLVYRVLKIISFRSDSRYRLEYRMSRGAGIAGVLEKRRSSFEVSSSSGVSVEGIFLPRGYRSWFVKIFNRVSSRDSPRGKFTEKTTHTQRRLFSPWGEFASRRVIPPLRSSSPSTASATFSTWSPRRCGNPEQPRAASFLRKSARRGRSGENRCA